MHGKIVTSMSMSIYIAHYRTVSLMRSMRRILQKRVRLQYATEAGDAEFWITQVVAQCVPRNDRGMKKMWKTPQIMNRKVKSQKIMQPQSTALRTSIISRHIETA